MTSDNINDRLDRFKDLIATPSERPRPNLPERYHRLAESMGGKLVHAEAGIYCLVQTVYPYGYRFGEVMLEKPPDSLAHPRSAFSTYDEPGEVDPRSLLFFDTETTGLGGAGTVAFLIGCGSLTDEGFEVRQYLLPDYSDEAAMLEAVLEEISGGKVMVSYNGLAFDMAVIRDRMIINRVAKDVEPAGHLDLLHPTRRLFRRRLRDCTLTNIERELFQYYRENDIPGYLIPSVYFSWVSDETIDFMNDVLEHNRQDIFALHFLTGMIAGAFQTDGEILDEIDDVYSLSRVYGRRKEHDRVLDILKRIDADVVGDLTEDILLYQSLALKRAGKWENAVTIWEQLSLSDSREGYEANVELAKYFEHRAKEHRKAYEFALRAENRCPEGTTHKNLLKKRLLRLQNRLKS